MSSLTSITQSNVTLSKFSLPDAKALYLTNPKKSIKLVPLLLDGKPFKLLLVGQLFTEGVLVSEEYGTHSIGFHFEDSSDVANFNLLYNCFDQIVDDLLNWESRSLIKNEDQIWFKLKYGKDRTSYRFKSNVKLLPKKPADAPLEMNDEVHAVVDVSAYFSMEDDTYGICLNLRDLQINPETAAPVSKKVKV
jgi:hypothetical protein